MAGSAQGAYEKGQRLAELVGGQRSLLILDGVEPLQYPPSSPTGSRLKDQGVEALLKGLAASSNGLCIVTTRYSIPDLAAFVGSTWHEEELKRLSREAGVALLKDSGVKGSELRPDPTPGNPDPLNEYEQLVEDVKGHALTLQIFGQYLKRAHHGDIRRRDRVELAQADSKVIASHGFGTGHTFRAIAAYEAWLADDSEESRRELAVLRLLSLFDRPATADCVQTLRKPPAIDGLTDPLVDLPDEDWEFTLTTLSDARLVSVNRNEATGELVSLDAHPLIREYFGASLRSYRRQTVEGSSSSNPPSGDGSYEETDATSEVWRVAHRRLYEHLCETTNEGDQPTLENLQPLYQAVAHGCHAGLMEEARAVVYRDRIHKGNEYHSQNKLGVFGSDFGAVACFFEVPWNSVLPEFGVSDKSWVLMDAAFCLRASGRLSEALQPMRAVMENDVGQERWSHAATAASNLSELELTLGEVPGALSDAERSVTYADRSGDAFQRYSKRTTHADVLHQSGRRSEAESLFREAEQMQAEQMQAEQMQAERQPAYPLMYSLPGFLYCDLLLAPAEREAWRVLNQPRGASPRFSLGQDVQEQDTMQEPDASAFRLIEACSAVTDRATQTLKIAEEQIGRLLDIAHLTLSCVVLYESLLSGSAISPSASPLSSPKSKPPCPPSAAPARWTTSPAVSSRERGSEVCSAEKQARTACRPTWTKPGRLPNAARCRCSSPTFIFTAPGCWEGGTERKRDRETRRVGDKEMALLLVSPHLPILA